MDITTQQWKLEKYARYLGPNPEQTRSKIPNVKGKSTDNPKWKLYEGDNLTLTVTESHHLLITHGTDIQENHSLWNAQSWMKGISKDDSLLLIYKIQNDTRQFRVKFAMDASGSALHHCHECRKRLSRYFIFKHLTPENSTEAQKDEDKSATSHLSLSKLAQIVSGGLKEQLPQAYQSTHITKDPDALQAAIQLCLSDTNFPAFVGAIETALTKVVAESDVNVKT